jgi:NAD(P)-dependent dehydrogenase (short-subunit alcohol dehydrogenase family)
MNLEELAKHYDLSGRTVAITGGAGVLGGEIACALVGCGANVAILDRDPGRADRLIDRLDCFPGCTVIVYADVLDRASLEKAEGTIRAEFGPIDTLINAAGGNQPGATTGEGQAFFDLAEADLKRVFDLNAMGTVLPCQVFGKRMAERGEGVIVNVSSMAAIRPLTRIVAYSAAKAALSNFTQWLAVHMAQEYSPGIRVNAVAPGFFLTNQNRYLLLDPQSGELTARGRTILEHTPMGRFGDPEDLLGTVLWLVSPLSAFVTGTIVPVDGGFSAFSGV